VRRVKLRREKGRGIVIETETKVTRNPVRELQEVLEAIVPSSFPRIGPSISFYQK